MPGPCGSMRAEFARQRDNHSGRRGASFPLAYPLHYARESLDEILRLVSPPGRWSEWLTETSSARSRVTVKSSISKDLNLAFSTERRRITKRPMANAPIANAPTATAPIAVAIIATPRKLRLSELWDSFIDLPPR